MKSIIKEVKFTGNEKAIMAIIEKRGEFIWSGIGHTQFKRALKELIWRELVVRKRDKSGCLVANVFVPTTWGKLAIKNNNAAKTLNK